jgi:hypothetical protein
MRRSLDECRPAQFPVDVGCGSHSSSVWLIKGSAQLEVALPLAAVLEVNPVAGENTVDKVVIGADPHKHSVTIEVPDEREGVDPYRQMLAEARRSRGPVGGEGLQRRRGYIPTALREPSAPAHPVAKQVGRSSIGGDGPGATDCVLHAAQSSGPAAGRARPAQLGLFEL